MHPQSIPLDAALGPNVTRIPLYRRDGVIVAHAIIDATDAAWVQQWRWRIGNRGYAVRHERIGGKFRDILLHRELLQLPRWRERGGLEGDHINRDRLDNRRANLRAVPGAHNLQNVAARGGSSRYRGVQWFPHSRRWRACAKSQGKLVSLGFYSTELKAACVAAHWRARHMPGSIEDPQLLAIAPPPREDKRRGPQGRYQQLVLPFGSAA